MIPITPEEEDLHHRILEMFLQIAGVTGTRISSDGVHDSGEGWVYFKSTNDAREES